MILAKMKKEGLWEGPHDYLSQKLVYAYRVGDGFVGVFEGDAFKSHPVYDTGNNHLYLGSSYEPVHGRDKVLVNGFFKILEKPKEEIVPVMKSGEVAVLYPLDHRLQRHVVEPSSFEIYDVVIAGVNAVGSQLGLSLLKMGVTNLTVFDPEIVSEADPAVSFYRAYDPYKPRAQAFYDMAYTGSMKVPRIEYRYPQLEDLRHVVINTFPLQRRSIWDLVKKSPNVGLFLDVQVYGSCGKVYVINPCDPVSVDLIESTLGDSWDGDLTVGRVGMVAGLGAEIFMKYVMYRQWSAVPVAHTQLNRMYTFCFQET